MSKKIKSESINQSFFLLIIILGLLTGIALVLAGIEGKKWLAAISLAIIFFYSLFFTTSKFRLFFLWLTVFSLPIRLNFHLIYTDTPYSQLKGLPVSLFDIVFTCLFTYWILQLLLKQRKIHFFPTISLPVIAYILLSGISISQAQDKILSFCVLLLIIKGYFVFLYFTNNINNKSEIVLIMSALAAGVILQSFVGSLQYFTGGTLGLDILGEGERAFREKVMEYGSILRVGGTIGEANSLAMYLNFFLPVLFIGFFSDNDFRFRILMGVAFILGLFVEFFTFSRGGWAGLGFGLFASFYGIFNERFGSRMKSLSISVIIFLLATILAFGLINDVRDRFLKSDYGSAYSRIPMMKIAFNVIRQNPLKGVGLNNYTTVMNRYDRTRESKSYTFPYPVHNAFLLIAAESGLLALLCFVIALLGVFVKAANFFQVRDRFLYFLGIGFCGGLLTWIFHAQFRMDFAPIRTTLWFSMAMIVAIWRLVSTSEFEHEIK